MNRKHFHSVTKTNDELITLYQRALTWLQGKTRITRETLRDELSCNWSDTNKVLKQLEENGMVSQAFPGKGREVLRQPAPTSSLIAHRNGAAQPTGSETVLAIVTGQRPRDENALIVLGLHCLRQQLASMTQQVDQLLGEKQ